MKSLLVKSVLLGVLLISPALASAEETEGEYSIGFGDGIVYDVRNLEAQQQEEENMLEQSDTPCRIYAPTAVQVDSTSATIQWVTNKQSTGVAYVSTQPRIDIYSPYSWFAVDSEVGKYHSLHLNGLEPHTTYYYVIVAYDQWGNTCLVSEHSFTSQ